MTIRTPPFHDLDVDAALTNLVRMTAPETGDEFFAVLVKNLAEVMGTMGAWVTEYLPQQHRLRARAFWLNNEFVSEYEYNVVGTPCEVVVTEKRFFHIPDRVIELFKTDPDLRDLNAASFMGMPLLDVDGSLLGHLAIIDNRVMPAEPRAESIFRIFAQRAAAEVRRLRAEEDVREREAKLSRLIDSAMDAIVEIDGEAQVTRINPAADRIFGLRSESVIGRDFGVHLDDESRARLKRLMKELCSRGDGKRSTWIPGGFQAIASDGRTFTAEATLSQYELHRNQYFILILRNVNDRLDAERQIETLTAQTEYLREELESVEGIGEIIGCSPTLLHVLNDVKQVSSTDTTVLINGETGTGKELIAHAIHKASGRSARPFVKVNCAAIPSNLMESEFFGHEKGAFTGATSKREGRFVLADGGTIFLDEVGELPVDLQSKLLRVLQEGEFEPVGSSRTHHVDVRVIAATNRDLKRECAEGRFRDDLYYRLNVFPITLPPLRDRLDDIPLLAREFILRLSKRMGRTVDPLTPDCIRRLRDYQWPGNIRELQNVIERGIITATSGRLNLDRALPDKPHSRSADHPPTHETTASRICTADEITQLERENITRALESCDWRVSGPSGAALLLGMKPTTLSSRMKALGIERPH